MNLTITWVSSWTLFLPFLYGCECDAWGAGTFILDHSTLKLKLRNIAHKLSWDHMMWVVVTFVSMSVAVTSVTISFVFGTILKVISHKISHKLSWCIASFFFFNQMALQCANLDGRQSPWQCILVFTGLSSCMDILYTNLLYYCWKFHQIRWCKLHQLDTKFLNLSYNWYDIFGWR